MTDLAIVIPNFNQSHFLSHALESLRFQSVSFSLAVMDGGSTDNFRQAVNPYADIISFLRSAPDNGQAAAIKEGLEAVSGQLVCWLNADDYYFPDALEKVVNYFSTHPDVDVVYGDAIHVNRDGFFLSYFPPIQEFNARDLTRTCFICQPACFVRRSAYEKVGGLNSSLHFTMDWDLWCRLAESGAKFTYLHEVIAAVRYYPGTKTLSGNKRRYSEIWQIERKYGKRRLPLSWPGFYLFDLLFKENKTLPESIVFGILQLLRWAKKRWRQKSKNQTQEESTNYGFHSWKSKVMGRGTIYFPWYDKRRLSCAYLRLKPEDCDYSISINDADFLVYKASEGRVSIDLPVFERPCIKIAIECRTQHSWELLDFRGELVTS